MRDILKKFSTTNNTNKNKPETRYQVTGSYWFVLARGLFYLLFFILTFPVFAQEASDGTEETGITEEIDEEEPEETEEEVVEEKAVQPLTKEMERVEMEIKSSSLGELALWCRNLGLSEGGTREELSRRIREYYKIPESSNQSPRNQKIITIESAQTTDYFTIDVINEDYARLKGDVYITLKDGNSTHRIKANDILFNKTRNILTASGGVIYEKVDADKTETFRGENITVNIDNWASVFLAGSSTMESEGTSYLFSGKVISRTDQDVTILRHAEITSTVADEAYWSISASKLWLLPGSDFAIFNAVLKVGEIPVLYIPFFYFPTDQLIFHPVIGYRSREGGFVQTTTYILGQPKSNPTEASSLSRILGNSNDMQLEREGLFLRSTGKKVVDPNEINLKAMIDYYVNLGSYFGIDLTVPKKGILNPIDFTLGIGLSRTVSLIGDGQYTPYNEDGTFDDNHSNLFSVPVPFRYRMRFKSSISGTLGTLSWDFPYYSDPFIDRDFLNRAESMDWVNMLQQGAALEGDATADSEISPYTWQMSGNISQALTVFAPYISRMSLNSISTTLSFKRLQDKTIENSYNPNRFFFAPDKWTIVSLSGAISGNPLSLGSSSSSSASKPANVTLPSAEDPLLGIGIPIPPWPANESAKKDSTTSADTMIPPVLRQTFSLPNPGNLRFNIDYQISPTFSSELQYMNSDNRWATYEDVDWAVQSILGNLGLNGSLNFRMDHSSGFFSNTVSFTGSSVWRDYFYLNEEFFTDENGVVDEEKMLQMRRTQFSQTNYQSAYSYNGRLQPFQVSEVFRQTSLSYGFRGTLVRSKRYKEGESPEDGPELTPQWGAWVKEETKDGEFIPGLNSHNLSANLAASIMDRSQNITVTANLPPLDEQISTSATFNAWISTTSISTRMDKLTEKTLTQALKDKGKAVDDWVFRPIDIVETLRFSDKAVLSLNMSIDPEIDLKEENTKVTSVRSSLTLWDFRANFLANKVIRSEFYTPDESNPYAGSWRPVPDAKPELLPRELSLTYGKTFNQIDIIRNWVGLNFNLNTSLLYNLQQHTNSNFQFSMGMTFKIAGFLDLTLTASSENKVIWRYFKDVPGMEDLTSMYIDGPQNNLFTDLFDSFDFSDMSKRERSGFKLQRFSLDAVHHLGDWTASFKISMYPHNDTSGEIPQYKFISDIGFYVQWTPITEIKSNISYDGLKEKWTVEN